MKKSQIFKAICVAVLAAMLLSTTAFASILGDLTIVGSVTEIGNYTYLHHNRFLSPQSGVGYQNEHFIVHTPNPYVRPVVTNGWNVFGAGTIYNRAQFLRDTGRVPIAGINGDFFSFQTGVSFGHTIVNNQIISTQPGSNPTIGFRADGSAFIDDLQIFTTAVFTRRIPIFADDCEYCAALYAEYGEFEECTHEREIIDFRYERTEVAIHCVNKFRQSNRIYMFDSNFGATSRATGAGTNVVLDVVGGDMSLPGSIHGVVEFVGEVNGDFAIPEGKIVLSIANDSFWELRYAMSFFEVGTEVEIFSFTNNDELWSQAEYALGTHAGRIVENGVALHTYVGVVNEIAFTAAPRSAIGITASGDIIFYTIDGRQPGHGFGLRLPTLAERMVELGAVEAINLDSGGSTTLAATRPWTGNLSIINRPSDGSARRVGNFIFLHNANEPSGELYRLYVEPSRVHVLHGSWFNGFEVHGADRGFFPAAVAGNVEFTAVAGESRVSSEGVAQAIGVGATTVEARVGNVAGFATVYSIENPTRVAVRREGREISALALEYGDEIELFAAAFVGGDEIISQNSSYIWSVDENLGEVDGNGVLRITTQRMESGFLTVQAGETLAVVEVSVNQNAFADIGGHWAEDDILAVFNAGIMMGSFVDGQRVFRPNEFMTRAELTTAIARLIEDYVSVGALDFTDLDEIPEWALEAVGLLFELGIITGSVRDDGRFFEPNDNITRAQVFTIIGRMLDVDGEMSGIAIDPPFFTDSEDIPEWALRYVNMLVEAGIVSGNPDGTILPNNYITRAEIARILSRII